MFKKEILQNQEKIVNVELKQRNFDIQEIIDILKLNKIIALIGSRRAWKTFLTFQIVKELIKKWILEKEELVYIDFSSILKKEIDIEDILESYISIFPNKKPFFIFDEIQELTDFPQKLIALLNKNYNIIITGSNAHMLSREISTLLRWKVYTKEIFPLSFKEFLDFKGLDFSKNNILLDKPKYIYEFWEFLRWWWFPEITLTDNEVAKENILKSYLDVMIYKDLQDRYNIKNDYVLKFFIKRILGSFGKEVNISKIYNDLKSNNVKVSKDTLYNFYEYLTDIYLISPLNNYWSQIKWLKKVYLTDISFAFFARDADFWKRLENIIYKILKEKFSEIFFLKKNYEIDFYIPKINTYIQVVYTLNDENIERETKTLLKQSWKKILLYFEKTQDFKIEWIECMDCIEFLKIFH